MEALEYRVQGRVWVCKGERSFLGPGRIRLLEKIDELGSIRAAAKALGMSYRHAWKHVEALNREAPRPMVVTSIGGAGGGGAKLTPAGRAILELFHHLERRFENFLKQETENFRQRIKNLD